MKTPLDELQWKSPEWIQAFGLRTENVLDYFAESPFFNKTANNQVIKMQKQFSQVPRQMDNQIAETPSQHQSENQSQQSQQQMNIFKANLQNRQDQEFDYLDNNRRDIIMRYPIYAMLERELSKMKGIEYVLSYVREPDFWVIKKQNRISVEVSQPLQAYYIIGANVYQSPSVFNIVQSRLLSTNYHLSSTLEKLHTLTQFEPSQGVQFKSIQEMPSYRGIPVTNGSALGELSNGNSASAGLNSVPATAMSAATVNTVQPGSAIQYDNSGSQDKITMETLDALMVISVKSTPEYI